MADEKKEYNGLIGKIGGHKGFLTRLSDQMSTYIDAPALEGELLLEAEQHEETVDSRLVIIQNLFDE